MFIIQRGEGTGHSLHLSHPNFFCLFVLHENMLTELSEVSALQTRRGCCWGGRGKLLAGSPVSPLPAPLSAMPFAVLLTEELSAHSSNVGQLRDLLCLTECVEVTVCQSQALSPTGICVSGLLVCLCCLEAIPR